MITNYLSINSDREENLIRIFPDFPVSVYRTDFSDPSYQLVSWHWHEELEFGFAVEGSVLMECGKNKHILNKGDIYFINSNTHIIKNSYLRIHILHCEIF